MSELKLVCHEFFILNPDLIYMYVQVILLVNLEIMSPRSGCVGKQVQMSNNMPIDEIPEVYHRQSELIQHGLYCIWFVYTSILVGLCFVTYSSFYDK